jgi:hypothetical protein
MARPDIISTDYQPDTSVSRRILGVQIIQIRAMKNQQRQAKQNKTSKCHFELL